MFKTVSDKFVGNLSFIRVYSGTYKADQPLVNARTGKAARTGGMSLMQGNTANAAHRGHRRRHRGRVQGRGPAHRRHGGQPRRIRRRCPSRRSRHRCSAWPSQPKARGDEQKISGSLAKIANEDPTFKVTRDEQTHELVITGMSQLHLDVMQQRLKRRLRRWRWSRTSRRSPTARRSRCRPRASTATRSSRAAAASSARSTCASIPCRARSTARRSSSSEFANKSQFEKLREDHCHYDPEHNFGFIDTIVGGTIPNQFMPAVEKGCKELLERGALAGYRIQDVAVEVYFGKDHDVDSSEAAFKTAGRIAFKNAFLAARPVLLEPIVDMEVTVPSKYTGAILGT